MLTPPNVITPSSGSHKESMSLATVLLPEPEGPTIALTSPCFISMLMPWRTSASLYLNLTLLSVISDPTGSFASVSGLFMSSLSRISVTSPKIVLIFKRSSV